MLGTVVLCGLDFGFGSVTEANGLENLKIYRQRIQTFSTNFLFGINFLFEFACFVCSFSQSLR